MDRWAEIERLALAREIKATTIKKWRQRGVPWRWRVLLSEDAEKQGLPHIPKGAFERVENI